MNEAMTITVTVPMTTPSTVRNERNLCDLKVSNAIRTLSVTSCLFIPSHSRPPARESVDPQRLDGVQFRSLPVRVYSEEEPDAPDTLRAMRVQNIGSAVGREKSAVASWPRP